MRHKGIVAAAMVALLALVGWACTCADMGGGGGGLAAGGPVTVTLSWNEACDLDLNIDGTPGYNLGGTPDMQSGPASESVELTSGVHTISVFNYNTSPDGNATLTLTTPGGGMVTRTAVVTGSVSNDLWTACSIDVSSGVVTDINTFE